MVKICCVRKCKSRYYPGSGISFYGFPRKNEELKKKWIDIIPTSRETTKNSSVCSLHFKSQDIFDNKSRPCLVPDAVPCFFPQPKGMVLDEADDEESDISETADSFQEISGALDSDVLSRRSSGSSIELIEEPSYKDVAVQTDRYNKATEDKLRHKVKILNQRLKRRDIKLKELKSILALKKKNEQLYTDIEYIMVVK